MLGKSLFSVSTFVGNVHLRISLRETLFFASARKKKASIISEAFFYRRLFLSFHMAENH